MKNYIYVYYDSSEKNDVPMEEVSKAWMGWFQELGDKIVDAGNPFNSGGMAVEKSGVSEIENFPATGYSIVKANSMEEAVDMAQTCPLVSLDGAAIRVYEAHPM